jgi:hypothetical protein
MEIACAYMKESFAVWKSGNLETVRAATATPCMHRLSLSAKKSQWLRDGPELLGELQRLALVVRF